MEIIGIIKEVYQPQSGTSKSGNPYTTQTILISYGDQYPKELAMTLMTRQVEQYGPHLRQGQQLKFYFDASSREYNGRFYTECTVWKIESVNPQPQSQPYHGATAGVPVSAQPAQYTPAQAPVPMPDYEPQYGAPPQSQYQQPPTPQRYEPVAANLPFAKK